MSSHFSGSFRSYLLVLVLSVLSCNQSSKNMTSGTNRNNQDISNKSAKTQNTKSYIRDSVKVKLQNQNNFFKDSCIIYGKIGIEYYYYGRPHFKNDPKPPTRQDFIRDKTFKIEFYPYLKNQLLKTIVTGKAEKYRYSIKLKKHKSYQIKLYYKKRGENIWIPVKDRFMKTGFKTSKRDKALFNINKVFWTS